ncbi:NYN domain-containing protein [Kaistia dalseonensis]|uniref:NYN domain-containing protein n=1 Tax=Kaistia dalseonensis TaxID=410840 RepID=A0ABU0H4P2_9HYPH|nr:NYN domain-containing protein [Kaistia dalseonensis]MCX5494700.1 NYN domain-containing protein [Kaistia dalseonensis]MDQ0437281.1 hypothetical protein [Kaistia dalseonensis]
MTATVKSVLFVDYDSLYLSLRARDPGIARRFALRPQTWIEAIEAGLLIEPRGETPVRRRILMRRCYADPKLLGKARPAFQSQGFQIVDCPPLPGRERNSAEIQMVLDTVDALGHQTGFEEFILLSADSDLTPVIFRLRSYNRSTTIYSTVMTAAGYRAIADGAVDEQALIALLAPIADTDAPEIEDVDEEATPGRPGHEKDELAVLARRIHQMANVPLYSPKVYSELFRALASEVSEKGYHFQATAENVAARMVAGGRNVSRRQVAFVVKGLALKGHVFSTTDTPQRLAEVFKEQVLYLARSAGIDTDEGVEERIHAWIVGRGNGTPAAASAPAAIEAPARPAPKPVAAEPEAPQRASGSTARLSPIPAPPAMPAPEPSAPRAPRPITVPPPAAAIPQPVRPIQVRPIPAPSPEPAPAPRKAAAAPAPVAAPPPVDPPAPEPVIEQPEVIVTPPPPVAVEPAPAPAPKAEAVPDEPPQPVEEPRPRPLIAPPRSRLARPATPEPEAPVPPRAPAPRPSSPVALRPPARRPAASAADQAADGKDPIESSILAAIAEAVDVLVVNEEAEQAAAPAPAPEDIAPVKARNAPAPSAAPALPRAPQPKAVVRQPTPPVEEDGDIGDEIQRILAAYSQNRKPPGK